ncbi:protein-glutamate methylesterase/protein-glutamine glutaminase [Sneathiella limimaris]|uniref:protein-glutamate methylesterase/protein-glutamine glutaminase n=1 Tax=Sneathiella limimaris TaxID=1964213 RepID=UPI0019D14EFD|nr:chemotaxis response regulator protein-glutamate methylesterase [Sneathiella limimaris]
MKTPYRVMIVDDSAVIRGFLSRWLNEEADIEVVASAVNGAVALKEFEKHRPEIVVLDIEMPEMDGMTALPKLIEMDRDVKVIMASTLTLRNADISMKALAKGAADYIPKPESTRQADDKEIFHRDLVAKIKALGETRRRKLGEQTPPPVQPTRKELPPVASASGGLYKGANVELRPFRSNGLLPKALAIGSSTGGPQALFSLFEKLKGKLASIPVFITQHMPATFTAILAEHLSKIAGIPCREAVDGEKVENGHIYLAPGDWHMTVVKDGTDLKISLNQNPPENFCRPAVDPMLRSLDTVFGSRLLTVILTGMGQDGQKGCEQLAKSGGYVIAQDEESSVVWGMPGAVATAGLSNAVLPLTSIPGAIENALTGRPS